MPVKTLLVIPMAENLPTATSYAEKINNVSENKHRLEVGIMDVKHNELMTKMDKEMFDLKDELSKMKPKRSMKRNGKKEPGRNSPKAKLTKTSTGNDENTEELLKSIRSSEWMEEAFKKIRSTEMKEERPNKERINSIHTRYTAIGLFGNETNLSVTKGNSASKAKRG